MKFSKRSSLMEQFFESEHGSVMEIMLFVEHSVRGFYNARMG